MMSYSHKSKNKIIFPILKKKSEFERFFSKIAVMLPLAERMRPKSLNEYIGQSHIIGKNKVLSLALQQGRLPSLILWGPPGVGKTTLAKILSTELNIPYFTLSAIEAGVKDVREMIHKAESSKFFGQHSPILFIDEIHRFNKGQQDALLSAVEKGVITLVGATTENPSFEINAALLSRCQVYVLKPFSKEELLLLTNRIIEKDELFKDKKCILEETNSLLNLANGDARKLCNILELLGHSKDKVITITDEIVEQLVQQQISKYDKNGEQHYDMASAFIKSIRGSDPNAAVYWMARMIQGGESPRFIARRLVISAAEDIGLANPNALLIAEAASRAVEFVGWPESRIILSQAAIYLACSSKSNSAYLAINDAIDAASTYGDLVIPLHLRNAPTKLMKSLDYGKNYIYPHNETGNFAVQDYLPKDIENVTFYKPLNNPIEEKVKENLSQKWGKKYDY